MLRDRLKLNKFRSSIKLSTPTFTESDTVHRSDVNQKVQKKTAEIKSPRESSKISDVNIIMRVNTRWFPDCVPYYICVTVLCRYTLYTCYLMNSIVNQSLLFIFKASCYKNVTKFSVTKIRSFLPRKLVVRNRLQYQISVPLNV